MSILYVTLVLSIYYVVVGIDGVVRPFHIYTDSLCGMTVYIGLYYRMTGNRLYIVIDRRDQERVK